MGQSHARVGLPDVEPGLRLEERLAEIRYDPSAMPKLGITICILASTFAATYTAAWSIAASRTPSLRRRLASHRICSGRPLPW
jgi:hypothetical protein